MNIHNDFIYTVPLDRCSLITEHLDEIILISSEYIAILLLYTEVCTVLDFFYPAIIILSITSSFKFIFIEK